MAVHAEGGQCADKTHTVGNYLASDHVLTVLGRLSARIQNLLSSLPHEYDLGT
jgi:hypothetical protein